MIKSTLENKAVELFEEIDNLLEGNKHYTKEETKENKNNFVSAIVTKDIEYLEGYYTLLEEEQILKIENLLQ